MILDFDFINDADRKTILEVFNDTFTEYPREKNIVELFEEQVKSAPESIALISGEEQLTYMELNQRANRLARILIDHGVKKGDIIGLLAERSIEMVVGILGTLKAGGAYFPIDQDYPARRVEYMLEDSKTKLLIIEKNSENSISFEGDILVFGVENDNSIDSSNPAILLAPDDLAYVMYTSGSTGQPKGVEIMHRNVIRLVRNTNYIEINPLDRILQTGAPGFDATTFEIWGALLNGAALYLVKQDVIIDAEKLGECLSKYKITVLWLTSPLFNKLSHVNPKMFNPLRCLIVGGDVLSARYINDVRHNCLNLTIVNGYGPTENTTFSVCFLIDRDYENNIPIGRPI
ncbi:MAG: AMP-binding protein, partial [Clostridiaceae bacterium]|nr:AMP-binding protein [Clostridiaceae bacterium]